MEKKHRYLRIIMLLLVSLTAYGADAQKKYTDKGKQYQYRSMENGKWNFHPGWYYVTFYPNYSGSNKNVLSPDFKEKKSEVKQMRHEREANLMQETYTSLLVQNQVDTIQPVLNEERVRTLERSVDAVYAVNYKSQFDDLFNSIDYMLSESGLKCDDDYKLLIASMIDERDLLKEEIDYIGETGPENQMEQAKREIAYEEVENKLKDLSERCFTVLYAIQTQYNLYH